MIQVTLDGTPLLGTRTGIGRYVEHLVDALARTVPDVRVQVTTWSARRHRVPDLPDGVRQVGARVPARLLRAAWTRTGHPTAELLGARGAVVHGTNFVVPPTRHARAVVTVHDLTFLDAATVAPANAAYAELLPRALRRGAHVVTPTEAVADAVRERYGLAADRVTATPLGVDPGWSRAAAPAAAWLRQRGIPDDYVVYVGSGEARKNVDVLVRAHRLLRDRDPGVPALVLAGPAGAAPRPDAHPGVVPAGWLEEDDLRRLVAGSRALVLPSSDEGFGLPVVEALATGRPVVVSAVPALLEVAGPHGVTAPPRDADALADALARVLEAPGDPAAQDARRAWAARWTWSGCAAATADVYRRLAAA